VFILLFVSWANSLLLKQGVVSTGRHSTGPPAIIRLESACSHRPAYSGEAASSLIIARRGVLQTTTDDDERRQRASLVYTMCRRASNKMNEWMNEWERRTWVQRAGSCTEAKRRRRMVRSRRPTSPVSTRATRSVTTCFAADPTSASSSASRTSTSKASRLGKNDWEPSTRACTARPKLPAWDVLK